MCVFQFSSKCSQEASQQVSGKEQAAVRFSKPGPKILCIGITGALVERDSSWGPLLEVQTQQLRDKLPR